MNESFELRSRLTTKESQGTARPSFTSNAERFPSELQHGGTSCPLMCALKAEPEQGLRQADMCLWLRSERNGSGVENACSCRGSSSDSQHPQAHSCAQFKSQARTWYTDIHASKTI